MIRLLPLEENQPSSSFLEMDVHQHHEKDSLMKEVVGNCVNEEYDSEFGSEDLDLLVSDN